MIQKVAGQNKPNAKHAPKDKYSGCQRWVLQAQMKPAMDNHAIADTGNAMGMSAQKAQPTGSILLTRQL
ncbi:hypothetical protein [Gilvimarinus xylanilyticus]|uniref:Uncharacterized protein n=1 Tax=Gilvimarinus xylanilyticus TaxID=2944139 RepID=A0A9X2I080_9GAMM|nr:hypothetical protein [Gilvimarinus xylanilyticus]MCP8897816.1 hypothetical protein [Gilvimarinus xylanilyticus]